MSDSLFRLDGRTALVAGAASGIGRASALGLARAGAFTICADIDAAGAERVAKEIGGAESLRLDITDEAAVEGAVSDIHSRRGRIDVLVSTPAVNVRKPLANYTVAEFDKVLALNLKGTFLIARAVARGMSEQKSGSIILMSSIRSVTTEPGQGVYAATKAGLVQLARTFAAELGPASVRVNCIAPGVVETPLTQPIKNRPEWYNAYAQKNALGRWAQADENGGTGGVSRFRREQLRHRGGFVCRRRMDCGRRTVSAPGVKHCGRAPLAYARGSAAREPRP
jgi:NAD(P)-dependent dehydrogenase (short-subunit alcohol dehydrogenase family)